MRQQNDRLAPEPADDGEIRWRAGAALHIRPLLPAAAMLCWPLLVLAASGQFPGGSPPAPFDAGTIPQAAGPALPPETNAVAVEADAFWAAPQPAKVVIRLVIPPEEAGQTQPEAEQAPLPSLSN